MPPPVHSAVDRVLVFDGPDVVTDVEVLGVIGDAVIGLFALAMSAGMTTEQFCRVCLSTRRWGS